LIDASTVHGAHPYPCKFPPESIWQFVHGRGDVLLDPFCGSGTTIVEAAQNGWKSVYGFDSNPIAVLITRFKTLTTDKKFFVAAESVLADFVVSAERIEPLRKLDFDGATHWFDRRVLNDLECIVSWIGLQNDERIRTWLRLSLSRIVNRVSKQDSETRYVAIERHIEPGETLSRFADSAGFALGLLRERPPLNAAIVVEEADIRASIPLPDASVDRIVTSPPYANSMDYYLYHKHRMNVLGFDFKRVQNMEIGSRHEYSSQRAPVDKWVSDYRHSLGEFRRVLRDGGDALVIIGDSQIAGRKIDAAELSKSVANNLGFHVTLVDSVPLDGRSRSFSRGFQRPNKFEHVLRLTRSARF
jgi:SAM-dependent methyltransferase